MCLIICEGKYDTLFLQEVIENSSELKTDRYTGKEEDKLYQQQDYMESFEYRPENVLIKGESGKDYQLQIYKNQLLGFDRKYKNHFLLWDLDGAKPEHKFEKYKNHLKQRFQAHTVKFEMNITGENQVFYSIKLTGKIGNHQFITPIIAFKTNLEEEANINRQKHNEKQKTEKTKRLASKESVLNFIKSNLVQKII
ncbi:MAG: hypothetical protein ABEJ95_05045 [Candidatus Nanohalobium sp.]